MSSGYEYEEYSCFMDGKKNCITDIKEVCPPSEVNEIFYEEHLGSSEVESPKVRLTSVFVLDCIPSKRCSELLNTLGYAFPLKKSLRHLKRCRKKPGKDVNPTLQLILGETDLPLDSFKDVLGEQVMSKCTVVYVPAYAPNSLEQLRHGQIYWPLIYKRSSWQPLSITYSEKVRMIYFLEAACAAARHQNSGGHCCLITLNDVPIGCAWDRREIYPLHHAALLAIEDVSRRLRDIPYHYTDRLECSKKITPWQKGVHLDFNLDNFDNFRSKAMRLDVEHAGCSRMSTSDLILRPEISRDKNDYLTENKNSVLDPSESKLEVSTDSVAFARDEDSDLVPVLDEANSFITHYLKFEKNLDSVAFPELIGASQYLCTGASAFLSREPCVMCAMALLHSRIDKVIFDTKNPMDGGLGGKFSINWNSQLNHHFRVFIAVRD